MRIETKMKTIGLAGVMALAVLSAAADPVLSANSLGVQKVTLTTKNAVIAVQWSACGTGGDISVQDIVKTANLSVGDQLMVYDCETMRYASTFALEEQDGQRQWVRTDAGGVGPVTLSRGNALLLSRVSAGAVDVYLHGQAEAAEVGPKPTIAVGTRENPKYTLLASPMAGDEPIALDDRLFSGEVGASDTVWVPGSVERYWQKGASGSAFGKKGWGGDVTPVTVAPGTGFWYVSRGGSPTVNWGN